MARCLLKEAKLPKKLWICAAKFQLILRTDAIFIPMRGRAPYESITGRKLNLYNINIFGRIFYACMQEKEETVRI